MWEDYCVRTKRKISRISDKENKGKNRGTEDDRTDEDSFLE